VGCCGFGAEESFRYHFRRIVGTSPVGIGGGSASYRPTLSEKADEICLENHRLAAGQARHM
jgi:hypothetical protein